MNLFFSLSIYLTTSTIFALFEFWILIYFRTPLSSSTSHSGDKLYNSGNLKGTNENLSINSYRRKYITNKKPGIKPASHFTERCKTSAPACRTRSLHYLTPKVIIYHFNDMKSCSFFVFFVRKHIQTAMLFLAWSFIWRFELQRWTNNKSKRRCKHFKNLAEIFTLSIFQ